VVITTVHITFATACLGAATAFCTSLFTAVAAFAADFTGADRAAALTGADCAIALAGADCATAFSGAAVVTRSNDATGKRSIQKVMSYYYKVYVPSRRFHTLTSQALLQQQHTTRVQRASTDSINALRSVSSSLSNAASSSAVACVRTTDCSSSELALVPIYSIE
jgi:hypothetical protein